DRLRRARTINDVERSPLWSRWLWNIDRRNWSFLPTRKGFFQFGKHTRGRDIADHNQCRIVRTVISFVELLNIRFLHSCERILITIQRMSVRMIFAVED